MKLSLIFQNGSLAGRNFELREGYLTVGRSERCSVRLDPATERIASKEHCYIEGRPDGFYLTDNQSTNGTYLNGARIQTAKLNPGDRIQFGKNGVEAVVEIEGGAGARAPQQQQAEFAAAPTPGQFHSAPVTGQASPPVSAQAPPPAYTPQVTEAFPDQPLNLRNSLTGLGGINPEQLAGAPPEKSSALKYAAIALTILGVVFLSVVVILLMFFSIGPVAAVVASVVAFIPAMIYLLPIVWLDRYDPEPLWLLALAFAWGALVSVLFSFFANTIFGVGVAIAINPEVGESMSAVVAAPIFEEASKGFGLLLLLWFFRRYFDDILDGIVFAGVIALGFATVENVLYYGRGLNQGGIVGIIFLFFLRGILSPFAHVTFTAMTGIGCGIARESHKAAVKFIFPIIGYLAAVCLHAIWNGMAVFAADVIRGLDIDISGVCGTVGLIGPMEGLCAFLIGYAILEIPLFFAFVIFAFYVMRRQNRIIREMLAIDVARGMIPEEHLRTATSAFKSTGWLLGGIFSGKFGARSRYLRSVGKLGLSYWHIQRATAAQGHTGSFQQNPVLREEVLKWRDKV